jgi:hypothetical protein
MDLLRIIIMLFFVLQNYEKPISRISIDPDKDPETKFYISELSSEVRYLKLETRPESMIDQVRKVLIDNDLVFVLSHTNPVAHLFIFSNTGKFIRQIGKQGRGPGEYSSVHDFALDRKNKKIYLIDSMGKLYVFDYSGNCLKTEIIASRPSGIAYCNNNLFLLQTWPTYFLNYGFAVTIKDLEQNKPDLKLINRKYIKFNKQIQDVLYYDNFWFSNNNQNQVSLIEAKFDTLYHISVDGKLDAKYIFDLKNKTPRDIFFVQEYEDALNKYSSYSLIIETVNCIILRVLYKSQFYLYFFNKNTGRLLKQNTNMLKQNIYNDYDGGLPFTPMGLADKNVIFAIQNQLKIKEKLENPDKKMIKNIEAFNYLKNLTLDAKITDNPILLFVTLKP